MSPYIADGYTRLARVDEKKSGPPLWIEYRPMLRQDQVDLFGRLKWRAIACGRTPAALRLVADEVVRRVVDWNLTRGPSTPVPVTADGLLSVKVRVMASVMSLVGGLDQEGYAEREAADVANLRDGLRLWRLAPQVARRNCSDCLVHVYNEDTGRRESHGGRPVRRPDGTVPPCRIPGLGCPRGTPERPLELSPHNRQAFRHYQECIAVGHFPDDAIVRRNALVIRNALHGNP